MISAEALLDDIQTETLQSLLASVASEISPPTLTHIDALDAHFLATGQSLNRGDVIEIQGPAASGKTHLLYHLIITCILPSSYPSVSFGGWNKTVVVFDTDGTFNVRRLQQLLISRLCHLAVKSGILLPEPQIQEIRFRSLKRLHVFRPTSTTQLAATLLHLPAFHTAHLPNEEIGLLAVDSISSFYWPDRFTVEQMRSEPNMLSDASPLSHLLAALQKLRISHGPVIVVTNWGLNALPDGPFYKQHLHPFPLPLANDGSSESTRHEVKTDRPSHTLLTLTHHITLPFVPVIQLQPSLLSERAMSMEEKLRNETLDKGEVVGIVRSSGNPRVGQFSFQIRESEISIPGDGRGSAASSGTGVS